MRYFSLNIILIYSLLYRTPCNTVKRVHDYDLYNLCGNYNFYIMIIYLNRSKFLQ